METRATPEPGAPRRLSYALCAAVVLLGVALHLASLRWGFLCDDYSHQLVLEGRLDSKTLKPWSLYDFGTSADASAVARESGGFPFWTDADFKIRFFRPLASASLWLDHALFGRAAVGYHASSLVWYALCLTALLALYRALELSPRQAALAMLIFACDNGTVMPVGWIANRNSVLEVLFTVLAVWTVARRAEIGVGTIALALSFAACAVLSKESGIGAFALVAIALALHARRNTPSAVLARRGALLSIACAGAYLVALFAAGFGSTSVFYPTPWGAPLEYAKNLVGLACFTPLGLATPVPIDLFVAKHEIFWLGAIGAFVLGAPHAVIVWRRVREHSAALLFAAWIVLALPPQASALPSDRLLFNPMVGGAGLLALFLSDVLPRARRAASGFLERAVAWTCVVTALPLSALFVLAGGQHIQTIADHMRRIITSADVGERSLGTRDVFVLQSSPHALMTLAPLSLWVFETDDENVRFRPIQCGVRALRWKRDAVNRCTFETLDEPFLTLAFERLFRTSKRIPPAGTTWQSGRFTFRVVRSDESGVRAISLEAPESLDDARYRFLVLRDGRWVNFAPPSMGMSLELPRGFKNPLMP